MFQLKSKAKRFIVVLALVCAAGLLVGSAAVVRGSGSASAAQRSPARAVRGWQSLPAAPVDLRFGLTSVWTGGELIVSDVDSSAAYDPATGDWRKLAPPPEMDNYCRRSAAWTGKEMLVWGCGQAAYDPAADTWRRLPPAPTRHGVLVWTGHKLIGWGGGCCGDVSDDGSAYDPDTNTWRKLAAAPIPGQQSPAAVWTGRELVILNGYDPEGKPVGGAAYDPAADSWRRIPSLAQRTPGAIAVWNGDEALLVGGGSGFSGGYAFDPAANGWRELAQGSMTGVPLLALWTGRRALELGPKTSAYDPRLDRWSVLPRAPQGLHQGGGAAVWTGREAYLISPTGAGAVLTPPRGRRLALLHRSTRGMPPPLPQCCGG